MKLKKGDKIAIIAPSGKIEDSKALEMLAGKALEGFEVKIFSSCYSKIEDAQKVSEIHEAFSDSAIKAIVCARGGYGSLRIVDELDWELICAHPKIFAGSSDISILLAALWNKCGLKSYHCPMILNGFHKDFLEPKPYIEPRGDFKTLVGGKARGVLWGGNMCSIVSLADTYLPNEPVILFLEDLGEAAYKIDRMFAQIWRSGLRQRVCALVLGDFLDANQNELAQVLEHYAKKFDVPSVWGYPITHGKDNICVPFGQMAELDARTGRIKCV